MNHIFILSVMIEKIEPYYIKHCQKIDDTHSETIYKIKRLLRDETISRYTN